MTPRDAARIIIETIVSSAQPETHMALDTLAVDLIDVGMNIDEIESGLNTGLDNGWFDLSGSYISVTSVGELLYSSTSCTSAHTLH